MAGWEAAIRELWSVSEKTSQAAASRLERGGPPAALAIAKALAKETRDTRQMVLARLLGGLKEANEAVLAALIDLLRSDQTHVRQAALQALAAMGSASLPALPADAWRS